MNDNIGRAIAAVGGAALVIGILIGVYSMYDKGGRRTTPNYQFFRVSKPGSPPVFVKADLWDGEIEYCRFGKGFDLLDDKERKGFLCVGEVLAAPLE